MSITCPQDSRPLLANDHRQLLSKLGWIVPLFLAIAGFCSLAIDIPVGIVFDRKHLPEKLDKPLREALEVCESFGHGFGATLVIVAVVILDPSNRRFWYFGAVGSLGSGLVANTLKLLVQRTRPRDFFSALWGPAELDQFASIPLSRFFDFHKPAAVWETFEKGFSGDIGMQSFPSAHTATAVGLAVVLASLYPRGRWFFFVLAILVGFQRVVSSAHFPSDVFAGALVGWFVGTISVRAMRFFGTSERGK